MTTYQAILPTFATSTSGVQDAMNSIGTLMTNSGWAAASDTGQMSISSVVWNSTGGTTYGYKIFYLNDSLHSTYPIYMRMYWRNPNSGQLGVAFTVGSGTDGAGNITGYKYGSDTTYLYGTSPSGWGNASNQSRACSLNGYSYWNLAGTPGWGTAPMFMLSREWDNSTGAIKSNGNYFIILNSPVTASLPQYIAVNPTQGISSNSSYNCFVPNQSSTSQVAGTLDLFRVYVQGSPNTVCGAAVGYHASEIVTNTTFSAQPLTGGSARTFIATGYNRITNANTSSTDCLAVLWE